MSRVMSRVVSRPQPRTVLVVLACVAACVAPLVLSDLTFFMRMVLAAIVVTGLSLLMGYSGQASLGQGAFVAAGALTVAVGTTRFELPPLVALLIAPLVAATFAALVGVPLLRLHGHYLAFGTLALLLMVQAAMGTFDVLGGAFGISGIPPLGVGGPDLRRAAALRLPGAGLSGAGAAAQPSDGAQPLRSRHPGPGRQPDRSGVGGRPGEPQQGHRSSRSRRATPAWPADSRRSSRPT